MPGRGKAASVKAPLLRRPSGAQGAGTRHPLRRAGQPGAAADPRSGVPKEGNPGHRGPRCVLPGRRLPIAGSRQSGGAARASSATPGPFAEPVGHPRGCRCHPALRLPDWLRQCGLRHGRSVTAALRPGCLADACPVGRLRLPALPDLERWIHAPRMTRSWNVPSPSRASSKRSANCRSAGLRS